MISILRAEKYHFEFIGNIQKIQGTTKTFYHNQKEAMSSLTHNVYYHNLFY